MQDLWHSGLGVLSTRVLKEFFVVVTTKIPKLLDVKSAKDIVNDLMKWYVVINDGESILDAIDIHLVFILGLNDYRCCCERWRGITVL